MYRNKVTLIKTMTKWRQSELRHEQIPCTLAECLHRPSSSRREAWRFWLIVLFTLPTLYYINDLFLYEKFKFMNRRSGHNDKVSSPTIKKIALSTSANEMTAAVAVKEVKTENEQKNLPICIVDKSQLGTFSIRKLPKGVFLENQYPMISKGGYYSPLGCQSRHKVGILVPYRDRTENLLTFIYNIHPFLMKQKLEYTIFVVEQNGTDKFNKGRVFNAGFAEMKKYGSWRCIVFHDVDLIPLDERILYSCPFWPRHMCATVVQEHADPTFLSLFGGVSSMTPSQYETVNGYSNLYWGWGGEDHDMFWRLRHARLPVTRYNKTIARYMPLPHPMSPPNPIRYQLMRRGLGRYKKEGLSTLEYKLVSVTKRPLYTHIVVDINPA